MTPRNKQPHLQQEEASASDNTEMDQTPAMSTEGLKRLSQKTFQPSDVTAGRLLPPQRLVAIARPPGREGPGPPLSTLVLLGDHLLLLGWPEHGRHQRLQEEAVALGAWASLTAGRQDFVALLIVRGGDCPPCIGSQAS